MRKTEATTMREEFRAELDRLKIIGFPKVIYRIELLNDSFNIQETYTFNSEKEMYNYLIRELGHIHPAFVHKLAIIKL